MKRRAIVLDANILIRAVLGQRVRRILEAHADSISFFVPETVLPDAVGDWRECVDSLNDLIGDLVRPVHRSGACHRRGR